jgi:hypothetical protein
MDKFEYVVALAAVITGLGLSDVAVSLHRLLKRRAGVVWDWVPITLALYFSLALMRLWYQLWSVRSVPGATDLPFVTVQVVQTLAIVLVASATLPDDDDFRNGQIDLRGYYTAQSRYIWTMYLIFELMWLTTGLYFNWVRGWELDLLLTLVLYPLYFGIPLVLTACALGLGRRWHGIIVGLLVLHEVTLPSDFFGLLTRIATALRQGTA